MYKVKITRTGADDTESAQTYSMIDPRVINEGDFLVVMDKDSQQTIYMNKSVLVSIQLHPQ